MTQYPSLRRYPWILKNVSYPWHALVLFGLVAISSTAYATKNERVNVNTTQAQQGNKSNTAQSVEFLGMISEVPGTWQSQPPANSMRLAQYRLPDEGNAEMVVFYFGPRQGGGAQANIARWTAQFKPIDGKPVKPKISSLKTENDSDVTWVEIEGDYARGVGMGPVGDYKVDQMLIAAITLTPLGNLYIQFFGDREKIITHRHEFLQFIKDLRSKASN